MQQEIKHILSRKQVANILGVSVRKIARDFPKLSEMTLKEISDKIGTESVEALLNLRINAEKNKH